jgi:hypothetical protein
MSKFNFLIWVLFLLWNFRYYVLWYCQGKKIFPGRKTGTSSIITPVEVHLFPFLFPEGGSKTSSLHDYCVIPLIYNFLEILFAPYEVRRTHTVNINISVFWAVMPFSLIYSTNVSKEHIASVFTAEESDDLHLGYEWKRFLWCVGTYRSYYTVSNPGTREVYFLFDC